MGAPLTVARRLISVEDYRAMAQAGVLREGERVELIEGELIQMVPAGGPHIHLLNYLNAVLVPQVGNDGVVSPQNPVILLPNSEPEPDLVILRSECRRSREVPKASDVLLVVEISVTSRDYDRDVKLPLYARYGVPEAWMLEPLTHGVTMYRDPMPNGYKTVIVPKPNDVISPLLLPSVKVDLADLWA